MTSKYWTKKEEKPLPLPPNVYDSPLIIAMEDPGWDFSHWSGDTQYLLDPNASQTTIDHTSFHCEILVLRRILYWSPI